MTDRLVGTVDGCIELRVVQVDPVGFFGARLNDSVGRESECVGVFNV